MRYKPCSDAQKYELKLIGKIKSQFFFGFRQIFRSIVQKLTITVRNMKHDIRRMALAAVIPPFPAIQFYTLFKDFLETGMDWNFTRLGVYPMEQRGVFGIFAHPLVHSSFKHLFANTIPLIFS